jgi:hypothetical protein
VNFGKKSNRRPRDLRNISQLASRGMGESGVRFMYSHFFTPVRPFNGGTRWRSCLKHYATSQKVAGSIPKGVI